MYNAFELTDLQFQMKPEYFPKQVRNHFSFKQTCDMYCVSKDNMF